VKTFPGSNWLADMISTSPENRPSPFRTLPLEIRNLIWSYVLGYQTVHLSFEPEYPQALLAPERSDGGKRARSKQVAGQFQQRICEAEISNHEAYVLSQNEEYDSDVKTGVIDTDMRLSRTRHRRCYEIDPDAATPEDTRQPKRKLQTDLSLLVGSYMRNQTRFFGARQPGRYQTPWLLINS
jgi:hypothetical protein